MEWNAPQDAGGAPQIRAAKIDRPLLTTYRSVGIMSQGALELTLGLLIGLALGVCMHKRQGTADE